MAHNRRFLTRSKAASHAAGCTALLGGTTAPFASPTRRSFVLHCNAGTLRHCTAAIAHPVPLQHIQCCSINAIKVSQQLSQPSVVHILDGSLPLQQAAQGRERRVTKGANSSC
jgi:hypothetical protein